MADSGSVSGFESDAGDVAVVDWTLPVEAREDGAQEAHASAGNAAAPAAAERGRDGGDDEDAATPAPTTSSGDWIDQASGSDDEEEADEEDEDEDEDKDEDEDEDDEPVHVGDGSDDAAAGFDEGDDDDDDDDDDDEERDAPTPTHARLLRLAYTVGSRLAGGTGGNGADGGGGPALPIAASRLTAAPVEPPRRPLQCVIAPLPVPPKPPHPPLLQRLNAAVAGDLVPRGSAGAAALLDRRRGGGAPLSACRRALRTVGGAWGASWGRGSDDDEEEEEEADEEDEEDGDGAAAATPQRRSARLAARAAAAGGDEEDEDDDDDDDDTGGGARDQHQDGDGGDDEAPASAKAGHRRRPSPTSSSNDTLTVLNTARLLLKRDLGLGAGAGGALSRSQRLHASALPPGRALPTVPCRVRDQMGSRAYVGQFSADGSLFVAAFQDRRVKLYDVGAPSGGVAAADEGNGGDVRLGGGSGSGSGSNTTSARRFFTRWRLRKDISTRLTRWTVTDTALSPDGRYLVYASITPVVWLVDVGAPYDPSRVDSRANETQLHDALSFAGPPPPPPTGGGGDGGDGGHHHHHHHHQRNFGVWSVAWAPGASGELVAGTSDRSALVYDMGSGRPVARMGGHGDDVNAVAHLDPLSPHLVVTGSDDALVRLWDRRVGGGGGGGGAGVASARRAAGEQAGAGAGARAPTAQTPHRHHQMSQTSTPVGVWLGHTEGITHLSPRGDGRVLLSNSKDQTARAWDARSGLRSPAEARALPPVRGGRGSFDYRWEAYPYRGNDVAHPHDASVQVYRGHSVLQSLVRARWSPEESTGGRYVYAGSADGAAVIWDAATAEVVARLSGAHGAVVRDAAWHPREPAIVTSSWDGRLIEWRAPHG